VIVVFKFDRFGSGSETEYRRVTTSMSHEFVPGIDDLVNIQAPGDDHKVLRQVWRRRMEINEFGEVQVTVYADEVMSLIRRRRNEQIEERAKVDLWKGPAR
jgi:hypothetical protein